MKLDKKLYMCGVANTEVVEKKSMQKGLEKGQDV
jgi:hypothetical protein